MRLLGAAILGLHRVHHLLRHRHARSESRALPAATAAFVGRRDRHRLRHLELRVLAHVADHVHADALVEALLQFLGQRQVLDDEAVQHAVRAQ